MTCLKENVTNITFKDMLRWFGHVERMSDERNVQNIYNVTKQTPIGTDLYGYI